MNIGCLFKVNQFLDVIFFCESLYDTILVFPYASFQIIRYPHIHHSIILSGHQIDKVVMGHVLFQSFFVVISPTPIVISTLGRNLAFPTTLDLVIQPQRRDFSLHSK
jgi:hypothetical protein